MSRRWAKGGAAGRSTAFVQSPILVFGVDEPGAVGAFGRRDWGNSMSFHGLAASIQLLAAALLGLAAGLRPTLVILLIPLMLWTAVSLHLNRKTAVAVLAAFRLKAYLGRGALY